MKKQLALVIGLCAHTALFPMFTAAIKSSRSLLPHINSCSKTTMLPVARPYSRNMDALEQQVVTYKKLHHELIEKEKQLAEACKTQDAYRSAKYFTCVFFTLRLFGDLEWGSNMGCIMDIFDGGMLAWMFHCGEPQEHINAYEKECMRIKTELTCRKLEVVEPLIQSIEQDACDGKGNPELYDSMQMIRTAMELGQQENNMITKEKHD